MSLKIGITGLAGAGKDTAGELLQRILKETTGVHFCLGKYATPLKSIAEDVFGDTFDEREVKDTPVFITPDLADKLIDACDLFGQSLSYEDYDKFMGILDNTLFNKTWLSPRDVQVQVGSAGRSINPNIWVEYLKRNHTPMIVTDVRYPNELLDYNILISKGKSSLDSLTVHHSELMCTEFAVGLQDPLQSGINAIVLNTQTIQDLETKLRFTATTIR